MKKMPRQCLISVSYQREGDPILKTPLSVRHPFDQLTHGYLSLSHLCGRSSIVPRIQCIIMTAIATNYVSN